MKTLLSTPPLRVSIGREAFDLRDANKSREGAFKHLLLLEEHLAQEACNECCHKHLFTAIAYLEEASRLEGGERGDYTLAEILRDCEDDLPFCGEDIRAIRKIIQVKLGYGVKGGPS